MIYLSVSTHIEQDTPMSLSALGDGSEGAWALVIGNSGREISLILSPADARRLVGVIERALRQTPAALAESR